MKEARVVKIANTSPPVFVRVAITTITRSSSSCRLDSLPNRGRRPLQRGDDDDGTPFSGQDTIRIRV